MMVVVKVAICDQGNVLFLRRTPEKSFGNLWDLPGGKLDDGELLLQALTREVREETGLGISDITLLDTSSHTSKEKSVIAITYMAFAHQGHLSLSAEHVESGWFDPRQMADDELHPGLLPALHALRERLS